MIKLIYNTASVKLLIAVVGLVIASLNARFLGAEGLGEVRIFTVSVSLLIIVANFVGGPHLIFRSQRHSLKSLLTRSYVWCILTVILFLAIQFLPFLTIENSFFIALSSMLYAMGWIHIYLLIGMEKIKQQNIVVLSFSVTLFFGLCYLYFYLNLSKSIYYIYLYVLAAVVQWLIGVYFLIKYHADFSKSIRTNNLTRALLKDGTYVQSGNLIQQLNYRIGDFVLDATFGKAAVGLYGLAVQLAEGVWTIARSASLVQYARLSNMVDLVRSRKITFQLAKGVVLFTILGFIVLLLLPTSLYSKVFGDELIGVRSVLLWLSPVFSIYSAGFIYSHYFSSQGQFKFNTLVSFVGLLVILIAAPLLIPRFGIPGAVVAHSASYLASLVGFIYLLKHRSSSRADRWMWPARKDLRWLRRIVFSQTAR